MSWISEHKRFWRTAVLILLLISLAGPWVFEQIHVPAEYACSPPNIRLEGDFCGTPLSGIWIFTALIGNFFSLVGGLFTGAIALTNLFQGLLFSILSFLLLLPFFTNLLLVLGKDRRFRFQSASWGLTAGIALLYVGIGTLSFSISPLKLWGGWLYVVAAATALILELLVSRAESAATNTLHF